MISAIIVFKGLNHRVCLPSLTSAAAMSIGILSHPRRRFPRFSVQALIVLALVIGTGLGWIVYSAHFSVMRLRHSNG